MGGGGGSVKIIRRKVSDKSVKTTVTKQSSRRLTIIRTKTLKPVLSENIASLSSINFLYFTCLLSNAKLTPPPAETKACKNKTAHVRKNKTA